MLSLGKANEDLYLAFRHYKLRNHIDGCPCCVNDADDRLLRHRPLHELTQDDLGRYSFKAMTTWGDGLDFRHFLPRILELLATQASWPVEDEIVLGKLRYANWNTWNEPERSAVLAWMQSWWLELLEKFPHPLGWQADSVLCAIGQAATDLSWFLDSWLAEPRITAARHLADFINFNVPTIQKRQQIGNPFWKERPDQRRQVERWLMSGRPREWLNAIKDAAVQEEIIAELSDAIQVLDWISFADR